MHYENCRACKTQPNQPIPVARINRLRLQGYYRFCQYPPHKDILAGIVFYFIDNSTVWVDKARDAGIGAANHIDPVFHRPEYAGYNVMLWADTSAEPGLVGDVNQELGSVLDEFSW